MSRGRHARPSRTQQVFASGTVTVSGAVSGAVTAGVLAAAAVSGPSGASVPQGVSVPHVTVDAYSVPAVPAVRERPAAVSVYVVAGGDTLSGVSARFCGTPADYPALAAASGITDANVIYPGQRVSLDCSGHPVQVPSRMPGDGDSDTAGGISGAGVPVQVSPRVVTVSASPSGSYSCSGLEQLWLAAGGNPADAVVAASVAMAESGGNPGAVSPTDDFGLWQINGSHGVLATLNPLGNAEAAVSISGDGTDWSPWTTFTSGAYAGRC